MKPGPENKNRPGFFRRFAAVFYDCVLLIAVLFGATAILLPINSGQAFSKTQFLYPLYLLFISFLFFGWFWTHGGQTLGMRSWKIIVLTTDKQQLTWKQAFIRFVSACLSWLLGGFGFVWILLNNERTAWHDVLSKTYLYRDDDN